MKFLLFTLTLLLSAAPTWAQSLSEKSYVGIARTASGQEDKDKLTFFLRRIPGRDGCFFGLLMKGMSRVSLYRVDTVPSSPSTYTLVPLEITPDGHIGITNEDPSLILTTSPGNKGQVGFTILSSGSGNTSGFQGPIVFSGDTTSDKWLDAVAGRYDTKTIEGAIQVSTINPTEREASTASLLPHPNDGLFILSERASGMYLTNFDTYTAAERRVQPFPTSIVVFIERKGVRMVMVDPKNDRNVTVLEK